MPPEVRAVLFRGPRQPGDFSVMVTKPKYEKTLFIICENIHDMLYSTDPGGGTAALRTYCYGHDDDTVRLRAAGVPTGWTTLGGFPALDEQAKYAIDLSFERILVQLATWDYEYIVYSCDSSEIGLIGAGLFQQTLGKDVIEYISKRIHELPGQLEKRLQSFNRQPSLDRIRNKELAWLGGTAKLIVENARLRRVIQTQKLAAAKKRKLPF